MGLLFWGAVQCSVAVLLILGRRTVLEVGHGGAIDLPAEFLLRICLTARRSFTVQFSRCQCLWDQCRRGRVARPQ
jgi:hypothetical protein